VPAGTP